MTTNDMTTHSTPHSTNARDNARLPGARRSPLATITAQAVRERLVLVGAVSALMVGMGLIVGALWPSLQDTFADIQESLPDAFSTVLAGADMSTPSGWANAEMMSMVAPAGAIAVAVISAMKATANEEQSKTMGVLLGTPVARSTFILAKSAAMAIHVLLVAVSVAVGLAIGSLVGDMGLGAANIIGAGLHVAALGLLFGSVAIAVGAGTGNSKLTTTVTAALGGLSFALASFLPLSDSLADGAKASPWYYYNSSDPLSNGADPLHLVVLLSLAAVAIVVGTSAFGRRDLRG